MADNQPSSRLSRIAEQVADIYLSDTVREVEEYGWLENLSLGSRWEAEARRDFYRIQQFEREAEEAGSVEELDELYEETLEELESGFEEKDRADLKIASDISPYIALGMSSILYPPAAFVALPIAWEYSFGNTKRRQERMYENGEEEIAAILESGDSKELLDNVYEEKRDELKPDDEDSDRFLDSFR